MVSITVVTKGGVRAYMVAGAGLAEKHVPDLDRCGLAALACPCTVHIL